MMVYEEVYEEGHECMIFPSAPRSAPRTGTRDIHDASSHVNLFFDPPAGNRRKYRSKKLDTNIGLYLLSSSFPPFLLFVEGIDQRRRLGVPQPLGAGDGARDQHQGRPGGGDEARGDGVRADQPSRDDHTQVHHGLPRRHPDMGQRDERGAPLWCEWCGWVDGCGMRGWIWMRG